MLIDMTMNPPKALLFDLDDTLISSSVNARASWGETLAAFAPTVRADGIDADALLAAIERAGNWFWSDPDRHRRGRFDMIAARREVVRLAFREQGAAAPPDWADAVADDYSRRRDAAVALFPDALETLAACRAAGVRLAMITNGPSAGQWAKIDRFDLRGWFDHILVEGDFGVGKPDPCVYRHILELMGTAGPETWMVGDNLEWDVAAPQRLGIVGIWHDAHRTGLPAGSKVTPNHIVTTLAELTPFLR